MSSNYVLSLFQFSSSVFLIPASLCFGLGIFALLFYLDKKFTAVLFVPSVQSQQMRTATSEEKTENSALDGHRKFGVLQKNSPVPTASKKKKKKKKRAPSEETNKIEVEIEETGNSFNETTELKENIKDKIKDTVEDSGFNETTDYEEDFIKVKERNRSFKKELKKEAHDDSKVRTIIKINKKEAVFKNDEKHVGNEEEPLYESTREGYKKITLLISNAPPGIRPKVIKTALEKIVGEEKILNLCQTSKLQRASQSFNTIFRVDVSDRKALKLLLDLKPKLNIKGQELIIEENKTTEAIKAEKETRIVFISRIPPHVCHEAIVHAALDARIGRGKVCSVRCTKNRITGQPEGVATAYCADVETTKLLLDLEPKLCINGHEVIIEEDKEKRIVFISHIPLHACDEGIVRVALEEKVGAGKVFNVRFSPDRVTGLPRGIATAYCANSETAQRLLQFNFQINIAGRNIKIVKYETSSKKKQTKALKVSVSNLPMKVTGEVFRSKIQEVVGGIDFLEIEFPLVKDGSKSKGFALINLTSQEAMQKLLALHQKLEIGGNKVNIHGHLGSLYASNPGNDVGRRNKDLTEYEYGGRGASANYSHQTDSDYCQNNPKDSHISHDYSTTSSRVPSQDDSYADIYKSRRQRAHESVSSNDSSNVHQGQHYQDHDNSNGVGWRRADESAYNIYGIADVPQDQSQQGCDNFGRVGWRQRYPVLENADSDSSDAYQGWDYSSQDSEGHGAYDCNSSDSSVSNHAWDQQGHKYFGRIGWRQRAYETALVNNFFNVDRNWYYQSHNLSRVAWRQRVPERGGYWDHAHAGNIQSVSRRQRAFENVYDGNNIYDSDQSA